MSKFIEKIGREWMFVTVSDAVESCKFVSHSSDPSSAEDKVKPSEDNV